MEARYSRNIPALTEEECCALMQKRILIVGCGGIGGYLLDMMLRIGIGTIRICDADAFESSNLNRQLLSREFNVGMQKVRAAAEYSAQVNPDIKVEVCNVKMTKENVLDLIDQCDVVLDALDNIESRKVLSLACTQAGIPYIFGAVDGWIAQAAVSLPGDNLIDILYPDSATEISKSVLSFAPALCASIQAALCVKLLTGRPVNTGVLYCFDLLHQEFDAFAIDA